MLLETHEKKKKKKKKKKKQKKKKKKKKKKKIANRKIMYIVRIFILHMQGLIGQKIQRIAWFQETQRFL